MIAGNANIIAPIAPTSCIVDMGCSSLATLFSAVAWSAISGGGPQSVQSSAAGSLVNGSRATTNAMLEG